MAGEISGGSRERCRGCGAEFNDLVCEYCGLASRKAEDPLTERAALDELHVLLRRCEPDAQAKLLREGFLPALEANLLEAAVLCLPYLAQGSVDPGPAAAQRVESILAKLSSLVGGFVIFGFSPWPWLARSPGSPRFSEAPVFERTHPYWLATATHSAARSLAFSAPT